MGLGRFELPTLGLGNQCSIHLSYSPRPTVYYSRGSALNRTQLYPNLYPTSPKAGGGGGQLWPMRENLRIQRIDNKNLPATHLRKVNQPMKSKCVPENFGSPQLALR